MLTSQRVYPPQEPTFSGEVAAGYLRSCVPFAVGATATIAIASLDIITDWIMYRAILDNKIPERVEEYIARGKQGDTENDIVWTLHGVFANLPDIMQGFLILGSLVFCLYFWWFCYMLVEQRKKFKDKRDGLPHKKKVSERYSGEVLILIHLLCEDLPVSVILVLAQISCSCTFFFSFDHVIYLIATCTTAFSLTWKLAQVTWNFGCFNFRENYLCSNGLIILRFISLMFITFTWALTAINFVLLRAGKDGQLFSHSTFETSVFDKIGVDRYVEDQHVVFAQSANFQYIEVSNNWKFAKSHKRVLTITPIKDIIDAMEDYHTVSVPCKNSTTNVTFNHFFKLSHRRDDDGQQRNCSVIFRFHLQSLGKEIQYDARYTFYDESSEQCVSDRLQIDSSGITDMQETLTPEQPKELSTVSNGDSSPQTSNVINPGRGLDDPQQDHQGNMQSHTQRNYLSFMSSLSANKYKNCKLTLTPNSTLLSEYDVCPFSS